MTLTLVLASHNEGKLAEIRSILNEVLPADRDRIELLSAGSLSLPDPVESGVSFEENALIKARDAARHTGLPAVADDSGLIVDFLGCAPGILSARWSGVHGDDEANNRLLLAQLADIPDNQRRARFRCAAALVVPARVMGGTASISAIAATAKISAVQAVSRVQHAGVGSGVDNADPIVGDDAHNPNSLREFVEIGEMTGRLERAPRGDDGFGYDPIFVPDQQPERGRSKPLTSAELTADEKNAISHRNRALTALVPHIARLLGVTETERH